MTVETEVPADYRRGFDAAIERAAKLAEDRGTLGYFADVGCFKCFERIAAAIRALR